MKTPDDIIDDCVVTILVPELIKQGLRPFSPDTNRLEEPCGTAQAIVACCVDSDTDEVEEERVQ
jgi:hypothetical protein